MRERTIPDPQLDPGSQTHCTYSQSHENIKVFYENTNIQFPRPAYGGSHCYKLVAKYITQDRQKSTFENDILSLGSEVQSVGYILFSTS